jgi:hypothetical protein
LPAILSIFVDGLAFWANEVDFWLLFCDNRIVYRQEELPTFLAKFFQGVMFNITLRANDHFSLLKSSSPEPLEGFILHFMCHRMNKFLPSDFNSFRINEEKN